MIYLLYLLLVHVRPLLQFPHPRPELRRLPHLRLPHRQTGRRRAGLTERKDNMASKYPHVFEPFEIRGVLFKNHLEQAPPGCFFAGDERGFVTDQFVEYFRQYARGGVAVCNVGNCSIDITESSDEAGQLQLSDPGCVMPARKFSEMCEIYGAHGSFELTHNGKDTAYENVGHAPYSASAFITVAEERRAKMLGRDPYPTIEMSKEKIRETVEKYARAARFCKQAGMKICMIHGAHGNLIAQFASPKYNKRTDEYGGSLQNRARFSNEILEAVRGAVGQDFVIEYRLSADEHARFPIGKLFPLCYNDWKMQEYFANKGGTGLCFRPRKIFCGCTEESCRSICPGAVSVNSNALLLST